VKISKLGKVVIIAGRNGAGKTRFLRLVKEVGGSYPGHPVAYYENKIAELETPTFDPNVSRRFVKCWSVYN
jgi:ABC-type transport system involved in cytochrome c biogenesis ATPase subunit